MFSRTLLVLAAVALVGCEQSTAPTQMKQAPGTSSRSASVTKYNQDFGVSGWAWNPCNNEYVIMAGTEHYDATITFTGANSASAQLHVNYSNLQGTGATTGLKYVLNLSENESIHAATSSFSQQLVANEELVSQSSAPNLNVKITQDVSFDGSNWTWSQPRYSITCQG